jgi:hypothetical protein
MIIPDNPEDQITLQESLIHQALMRGERGYFHPSPTLHQQILFRLRTCQNNQMSQIFFVTAYYQRPYRELGAELMNLLKIRTWETEEMVRLLMGLRRHYIAYFHIQGEKIPQIFFNELSFWITHENLEIREWALRTLEECGLQACLLKTVFTNAKPVWWKLFQRQARACLEIAVMLERRCNNGHRIR